MFIKGKHCRVDRAAKMEVPLTRQSAAVACQAGRLLRQQALPFRAASPTGAQQLPAISAAPHLQAGWVGTGVVGVGGGALAVRGPANREYREQGGGLKLHVNKG